MVYSIEIKNNLKQIIDDVTDELIIPFEYFKKVQNHFIVGAGVKFQKNPMVNVVGQIFLGSLISAISRQMDTTKTKKILSLADFIHKLNDEDESVKDIKALCLNLRSKSDNIIMMRHNFIAHRNMDARKSDLSVNLKEIEGVISGVEEIVLELDRVINLGGLIGLLPENQFDDHDPLEIFKP